MIPHQAIINWSLTHPWSTLEQVEQDLILSRAICIIASDPYLGTELTFRGGTALHKLHLPQSLRYSEDLDYTRSTSDGVGRILDTLKDAGRTLGFAVKSLPAEIPPTDIAWVNSPQELQQALSGTFMKFVDYRDRVIRSYSDPP